MAIPWPQHDKPMGLSGGSDLWDSGLAGTLLLEDYFVVTPPVGPAAPIVKYWTGSAWAAGNLCVWTGAAWEAATLKRWNGSTWVLV